MTQAAVTRIGFVGLGMMGRPMAHLLHAAGHDVAVNDVDRQAVQAFIDAHPAAQDARAAGAAQAAVTPADFAACEVLITMLPNSDIVDRVVNEIAPHLAPGTCVIDMSSANPNRTRKLAADLARRQIGMLDAPVSGGVKKVVSASLAIMVGGERALYERFKLLLEAMGRTTHVGAIGAGHALKALNNYVSAAALIATAEAIHVGAAFGIDRATIVDVINTSTGRNNTTENKAHQFMLNGAFDSGFSLALQAKDVSIARDLGREMGVPMRLGDEVDAMTSEASKALGPGADHTEVYKFVRGD